MSVIAGTKSGDVVHDNALALWSDRDGVLSRKGGAGLVARSDAGTDTDAESSIRSDDETLAGRHSLAHGLVREGRVLGVDCRRTGEPDTVICECEVDGCFSIGQCCRDGLAGRAMTPSRIAEEQAEQETECRGASQAPSQSHVTAADAA